MKNKRKKKLKLAWENLSQNISTKKNPFKGMSKEQVINILRKTRESIWEEKLATRP